MVLELGLCCFIKPENHINFKKKLGQIQKSKSSQIDVRFPDFTDGNIVLFFSLLKINLIS